MMNVNLTNEVREIHLPLLLRGSSLWVLTSLIFEGPVTFTLDSRKFEYIHQPLKAPGSSNANKNVRSVEKKSQETVAEDDQS